jgi:hypothetical protein
MRDSAAVTPAWTLEPSRAKNGRTIVWYHSRVSLQLLAQDFYFSISEKSADHSNLEAVTYQINFLCKNFPKLNEKYLVLYHQIQL